VGTTFIPHEGGAPMTKLPLESPTTCQHHYIEIQISTQVLVGTNHIQTTARVYEGDGHEARDT
jgi:hypothetical protein